MPHASFAALLLFWSGGYDLWSWMHYYTHLPPEVPSGEAGTAPARFCRYRWFHLFSYGKPELPHSHRYHQSIRLWFPVFLHPAETAFRSPVPALFPHPVGEPSYVLHMHNTVRSDNTQPSDLSQETVPDSSCACLRLLFLFSSCPFSFVLSFCTRFFF